MYARNRTASHLAAPLRPLSDAWAWVRARSLQSLETPEERFYLAMNGLAMAVFSFAALLTGEAGLALILAGLFAIGAGLYLLLPPA